MATSAPLAKHGVLHISEIVPGSPLPSRISSITGQVSMLKPCNPGDPINFAVFTKVYNAVESGTNAKRLEMTSITLKFTTGSFIYPKSISVPELSTSTVSSSPLLSVAKKFEEIMEMLRHNSNKDATIFLRHPTVLEGSEVAREYPSLVVNKERKELSKHYKIEVEFSKGLLIKGKDGVLHELYKEAPASWFASNTSSEQPITEDAPPCGQAERRPSPTEYIAIGPSIAADRHPDIPKGILREDRDIQMRTGQQAEHRHHLEEAYAESSTTALARATTTKRASNSICNDSGLEADGTAAEGSEGIVDPERPAKRQRLALTSSDEINHGHEQGRDDGTGGSAGRAVGRIPAGKENADGGTRHRVQAEAVRMIKEEVQTVIERRRDSGTAAGVSAWSGLYDGVQHEPVAPPPPAEPIYRPRTFDELTAWAAQGPPTIIHPTCQLTYTSLGGMGANEKNAPAGERLPMHWNLIAVINSIEAKQYRVGQDHLINLNLTDPTRHAGGDYIKFSLFSSTAFRDFPVNAGYGSVILIRNAHPNRWQGGRLMARCAAKELWSFAVLDKENNFHYGVGSRDPRNREGLTSDERDYMRALFDWQKVCHSGMEPSPYNMMYHGPRLQGDPRRAPPQAASRIQLGQRPPEEATPDTAPPSQRAVVVECSKEAYTSHIAARVSTIAEIIACRMVPFHFRLKAPVQDTLPSAGHWEKCVIKWCKTCEASFTSDHCIACEDSTCAHAEYRFRFWALLGGEGETSLPVQIWQPHMPLVFPVLPKVIAGEGLSKDQLKGLKLSMLDMLLGKRVDGERPRLPLDWSIEAFWMQGEDGFRHRMFRAFDMI